MNAPRISEAQTFTLSSLTRKGEAAQAVFQAPEGWVCTIEPPRRSIPQNRLQHKWWAEIARQRGDMTPAEVKAEAKAWFGVPILRGENDEFRERYDEVIKPLPRELKLKAMHLLPVTSLMNKDQHRRFLDEVYRHYTWQGFRLTLPEREAA